jgi:hypothetical protein
MSIEISRQPMGEGWKYRYFHALRTTKFGFSDETE